MVYDNFGVQYQLKLIISGYNIDVYLIDTNGGVEFMIGELTASYNMMDEVNTMVLRHFGVMA